MYSGNEVGNGHYVGRGNLNLECGRSADEIGAEVDGKHGDRRDTEGAPQAVGGKDKLAAGNGVFDFVVKSGDGLRGGFSEVEAGAVD